jgi:trk system potassium uptake protein TrkA
VVHVVVVGCGRVGSGLAVTLEEQGHTVAIIDRRAEAFRRLPDSFGGDRVQGVGFDQARLRQAGIERAEAVAAVTNGDNSNIVVARVAREAFAVDRVVARIYDQRRAAIYERVGIPTVATVQWTIERILRRVLPDVSDVDWIDPSAQVALVERLVPPKWGGHPVEDLEQPLLGRLAALTRLGKAQIPGPNLVVQEGDVVWVMVSGDGIDAYDNFLAAGPAKGSH